jgi:hypothetical protein
VYKGPSGRMGEPDTQEGFIHLRADDLSIYLSQGILDELKPGQSKLLVAVPGYGRFWLYLEPKPDENSE